MKATLEIDDALFRQAEGLAAERGTTLQAIVEAALRRYLEGASGPPDPPFRLRRHTFHGKGLQAGLERHDWAAICERVYRGLGG